MAHHGLTMIGGALNSAHIKSKDIHGFPALVSEDKKEICKQTGEDPKIVATAAGVDAAKTEGKGKVRTMPKWSKTWCFFHSPQCFLLSRAEGCEARGRRCG